MYVVEFVDFVTVSSLSMLAICKQNSSTNIATNKRINKINPKLPENIHQTINEFVKAFRRVPTVYQKDFNVSSLD